MITQRYATAPRFQNSVPFFLDFEASSLAEGSYPIEIAWGDMSGVHESHLISPTEIKEWTDWSIISETVHGISKHQLHREGRSPKWVCERVCEALDGRVVYSDAPSYDGFWLSRLFEASGYPLPAIRFEHIDRLLLNSVDQIRAFGGDIENFLSDVKVRARRRAPGQHRAAWDVVYLIECYRLARA